MKICKYILSLIVLICSTSNDEVYSIMDTEKPDNNDSIYMNLNDSVRVGEITIKWNSLVAEESVEPDGSFGGQAVNLGIQLKGQEAAETWYITLPVPYKEFINQQPEQVSYGFQGYTITIVDADFEKLDEYSFVILKLQKAIDPKATYYIDYKEVGKQGFMNLFNTLQEVEGTWYCAETREGGITGYTMKNSQSNKLYHYQSETENGTIKISLCKDLE